MRRTVPASSDFAGRDRGHGRRVTACQLRSGSPAVSASSCDPGAQPVLGAEPRVGDAQHRVAVHAADGAGERCRQAAARRCRRLVGVPGPQRRERSDQRLDLRLDARPAARRPSGPGGRSPRRHSAGPQAAGSAPASRATSQRSPTRPLLQAVQLDAAAPRRARRPPRPPARRAAGAGTPRAGCSRKRTRSASSTPASARGGGSGPVRNGAAAARQPAAPRAGQRRRVEAERAVDAESAGVKLRGSNGCSGWRTMTCSRTGWPSPVRTVASTRRAARRAARGRPRRVGTLVGSGVGHDQVLLGRADGVEQQLPVLAARVALADPRVAGQHVVAVDAGALRGKTPSSRPSRQTTRCGTERIGTSVQTVRLPVRKLGPGRPARQAVGEQRAYVGQRQRHAGAVGRGLGDVGELAAGLAAAASRRGRVIAASASSASDSAAIQLGEWLVGRSAVVRGREPVDQLGEPAGQVDVAAVDVVERQRHADQPQLVLPSRRRAAAGRARPARCSARRRRAGTAPGARRRAPTGRPSDDPVAQPLELVVVEPEPAPHRRQRRQVEHLRGGDPARRRARAAAPAWRAAGWSGAAPGRRAGPAAGGPGARPVGVVGVVRGRTSPR